MEDETVDSQDSVNRFIAKQVADMMDRLDESLNAYYAAFNPEGMVTAEWLMEKHPELTPEEAEEYRLFCKANTIVFKGCYGDGSIMWPLWVSFREEIAAL